ncbi:MAG: P22 coat - protein 5 family protein [Alphaproteobacteria bacterium]
MANTLTALQPTLFSAAREVANEPFGIVPAINTMFDDKGVARGDTVTVPVAPVRVAADFTPANVPAAGTDATAASVGVQITKSRFVSWNITGEQIRSLENGASSNEWVSQLIKQGMRTLRNEAEVDAGTAIKVGASRAYGTAGTTPFASDLTTFTNVRKILEDNGAPVANLSMAIDSAAALNLRGLGIYQQAYQAGSDKERRSGSFDPQFGITPVLSAGVGLHTKGTGTSYTSSTAGFAVGTTSIPIITGTGTVLAGDVVSFAGDGNKYVVTTGVAAAGTIVIAEPGLRIALAASAVAMTIGNNYTANVVFEKQAVVGVIRPPIMPANPTINQVAISDQFGMTYLLLDIAQYGQRTWELHLAWGFKTVTPMFTAIALG